MIRVVLADDEPFARSCMLNNIDWKANGCEIAGVCKNGLEVIELLKTAQADVLVTDIKMPHMDGLELVKYIRDRQMDLRVIIISGYEEFEYAKRAIDYKVDGYLLKPIVPDELLEKIRQVGADIQEKRAQRAAEDMPRALFARALKSEDYEIPADYAALEDWFYAVVCIHVNAGETPQAQNEMFTALEAPEAGVYYFKRIWNHSVFLAASADSAECRDRVEKLTADVSRVLEDAGMPGFNITTSNICAGLDSILCAHEEASKAMLLRGITGSGKTFFGWKHYKVEYRLFREDILAIDHEVRKGRLDSALSQLNAVFEHFARENCSMIDVQMFSENLLFALNENEHFSRIAETDEEYAEGCMKIFMAESPERIREGLEEIVHSLINRTGSREGTVESLIENAKEYVRSNLRDPELSLNKVARYLNHNLSYFSYVFSNATNMTLSKYIIVQRMEAACDLLKNTDGRIAEISEMVGYQNSNYFSKLFKREKGMTPKEYRQLYRGTSEE